MYTIQCSELTGIKCDFVAKGETIEETKNTFYAHGAGSSLHKEAYESATEEAVLGSRAFYFAEKLKIFGQSRILRKEHKNNKPT